MRHPIFISWEKVTLKCDRVFFLFLKRSNMATIVDSGEGNENSDYFIQSKIVLLSL